jgi:hypothetical protein
MVKPRGLLYNPRRYPRLRFNGILNVFGVYDHTNNKMWTHGYKKKTGKQFIDFIKRVDQRYDSSIKRIYLT